VINPNDASGFSYANFGLPTFAPGGAGNISGKNENMGNAQAATSYRYQSSAGGGQQQHSSGYYDEGYYPMAGFEMPDFSAFIEAMGANQIDFASIYAQQAAAAAKAQGLAQVSAMYTAKFDAADKAVTEVNQQIADETAPARLVGLDYNVDEASKQARINDLFANYWSEADESSLTGLTKKYGNAGYKWDLPVERGKSKADAAKEKTPGDKAGQAVTAKTKGTKLTTEENPLGSSAVLG